MKRAAAPLVLLACAGVLLLALAMDRQRRGPDPQIKVVRAAGRVDHCPTCHALDDTHLGDKLLTQHPARRFACTTCHGAGGRRVDQCLPSRGNEVDKDGRALAGARTQASCLACHDPAQGLPGAPRLTAGIRAYTRLGCAGCHKTSNQIPARRPVGPPLATAAVKLYPAALRAMVATPQKIHPGTAMPSYWDAHAVTGAPAWARDKMTGSRDAQLEAVLAAIRHLRPADEGAASSQQLGVAKQGERLFSSLGCMGCHLPLDASPPGQDNYLKRRGPALHQAGDGLRPGWLTAWLRDPARIWPQTRMPNLRLNDAEAAHLAAYIINGGPKHKVTRPAPADTPAAMALGQKLLQELGCLGCHPRRAGEAARLAVGPDLTGFGNKPLERLDWGASTVPARDRTVPRWTRAKLTTPRVMERPGGALKMPWQHLRRGELPALELLLRAMDGQPPPPGLTATATPRNQRLRRGEALVQELGCKSCHRLLGSGGGLLGPKGRPSSEPPNLDGIGAKLQPGWLMSFLRQPVSLRPWLGPRMPRFNLDAVAAATLASYLAALDGVSFPAPEVPTPALTDTRLASARRLFHGLQCLRCHQLSNVSQLKPGELAPDLALGATRLRPSWIRRFILDPQAVIPGTRMPELFPLADEDDPGSRITPAPGIMGGDVEAQVNALTDLSLWWGQVATSRQGR